MIAQKDSTESVISRCKRLGVKTVGGGPLFNSCPDDLSDVDHLVLGEGERKEDYLQTPQALQRPTSQGAEVSSRRALWYSSIRNALLMPWSMKSHGRISSRGRSL